MKKIRVALLIAIVSLTTMAFERNAGIGPEGAVEPPMLMQDASNAGIFPEAEADHVIIQVVQGKVDRQSKIKTYCSDAGMLTALVTIEETCAESASSIKCKFQKAKINEVLISYLMTGYEIESTEEGPRVEEPGVHKTFFLRRV